MEGFRLDGNVFRRGDEVRLPLYEAKMVASFDHRAAHVVISKTAAVRQGQPEELSDDDHADPWCLPIPRYWVPKSEVDERLGEWRHGWLLGLRDITSATNERTVLATILPQAAVGKNLPIMFFDAGPTRIAALAAYLSSLVFDHVARQKLGSVHLNFFMLGQLATLGPSACEVPTPWRRSAAVSEWLRPRVLKLVYTAWDLRPFARDLGYDGPPFRSDPERRFLLRAELDAAFFHLYGVRRKDEAKWGEYRTKRMILEVYDAMARAIETGEPYQTVLDPPPVDARIAHLSGELQARHVT